MLDRSAAELLNRAAQHQPGRLLAPVAATWLLAVPILAVLWLAGRAIRQRQAHPLTLLALAAVGAVAAFGLRSSSITCTSGPPRLSALPAIHRRRRPPRRQLFLLPQGRHRRRACLWPAGRPALGLAARWEPHPLIGWAHGQLNAASTSVSNAASSSGPADGRASRRSRTTASPNPDLLAFIWTAR
jgi:hypothetical protein